MPNFWPPPLHVEDPNPTVKYLNSKVWVCAPFFVPDACSLCKLWAEKEVLLTYFLKKQQLLRAKHFSGDICGRFSDSASFGDLSAGFAQKR